MQVHNFSNIKCFFNLNAVFLMETLEQILETKNENFKDL